MIRSPASRRAGPRTPARTLTVGSEQCMLSAVDVPALPARFRALRAARLSWTSLPAGEPAPSPTRPSAMPRSTAGVLGGERTTQPHRQRRSPRPGRYLVGCGMRAGWHRRTGDDRPRAERAGPARSADAKLLTGAGTAAAEVVAESAGLIPSRASPDPLPGGTGHTARDGRVARGERAAPGVRAAHRLLGGPTEHLARRPAKSVRCGSQSGPHNTPSGLAPSIETASATIFSISARSSALSSMSAAAALAWMLALLRAPTMATCIPG